MIEIIRAARLCEYLYTKVEKAKGLPADGGLGFVGVDELAVLLDRRTDSEAFLCVSRAERLIHVVVRGSETPFSDAGMVDWITNFLSFKVPFATSSGEISVHRGYSRSATALAPSLVRMLDAHPDFALVITGHSLGGSVAVLLAIILGLMRIGDPRFHEQLKVITFGQRMVASAADLEKVIDFQYTRVQNGADVACRTPALPGYGHRGGHVYYPVNNDAPGIWWHDPDWLAMFSDRMTSLVGRVTNHSMTGYRHRTELAFDVQHVSPDTISEGL